MHPPRTTNRDVFDGASSSECAPAAERSPRSPDASGCRWQHQQQRRRQTRHPPEATSGHCEKFADGAFDDDAAQEEAATAADDDDREADGAYGLYEYDCRRRFDHHLNYDPDDGWPRGCGNIGPNHLLPTHEQLQQQQLAAAAASVQRQTANAYLSQPVQPPRRTQISRLGGLKMAAMHDTARRLAAQPLAADETATATTTFGSVDDSDGAGSILTTTTTVSSTAHNNMVSADSSGNNGGGQRRNLEYDATGGVGDQQLAGCDRPNDETDEAATSAPDTTDDRTNQPEEDEDLLDDDDEQLQLIVVPGDNKRAHRCRKVIAAAAAASATGGSSTPAASGNDQRVASIALRLAQSQAMAVAGFLPESFEDNEPMASGSCSTTSPLHRHYRTGLQQQHQPHLPQRASFHGERVARARGGGQQSTTASSMCVFCCLCFIHSYCT